MKKEVDVILRERLLHPKRPAHSILLKVLSERYVSRRLHSLKVRQSEGLDPLKHVLVHKAREGGFQVK